MHATAPGITCFFHLNDNKSTAMWDTQALRALVAWHRVAELGGVRRILLAGSYFPLENCLNSVFFLFTFAPNPIVKWKPAVSLFLR